MAITGALLVSYYQNNFMMLLFITAVAITILLVAFNKFIPETLFPLAVIVISISLLYNSTLDSPFISNYDIQAEYYYQNFVTQNGFWDSDRAGNVNTALSIVLISPIYSVILNLDAVWIFKIV